MLVTKNACFNLFSCYHKKKSKINNLFKTLVYTTILVVLKIVILIILSIDIVLYY